MKQVILLSALMLTAVSSSLAASNLDGIVETRCTGTGAKLSYSTGHALKGSPLLQAHYNGVDITEAKTQFLADASSTHDTLKFFIKGENKYRLMVVSANTRLGLATAVIFDFGEATYKEILETGDASLFPSPEMISMECTTTVI